MYQQANHAKAITGTEAFFISGDARSSPRVLRRSTHPTKQYAKSTHHFSPFSLPPKGVFPIRCSSVDDLATFKRPLNSLALFFETGQTAEMSRTLPIPQCKIAVGLRRSGKKKSGQDTPRVNDQISLKAYDETEDEDRLVPR